MIRIESGVHKRCRAGQDHEIIWQIRRCDKPFVTGQKRFLESREMFLATGVNDTTVTGIECLLPAGPALQQDPARKDRLQSVSSAMEEIYCRVVRIEDGKRVLDSPCAAYHFEVV